MKKAFILGGKKVSCRAYLTAIRNRVGHEIRHVTHAKDLTDRAENIIIDVQALYAVFDKKFTKTGKDQMWSQKVKDIEGRACDLVRDIQAYLCDVYQRGKEAYHD